MRTPRWLRRSSDVAGDIRDEVDSHLAMARRDRESAGETPEQAAAAARREFGNAALVREETRAVWAWTWLEQLAQDTRYGVRQLRRQPGFTIVAVLSLALGIGAGTVIFSAVDAVILRRLPFREPARLVEIFQQYFPHPAMDRMDVSVANFLDWQADHASFDGMAADRLISLNLSGPGGPERIRGAAVTANAFELLGRDALVGRVFRSDTRDGDTPVAVLSYSLWQRRFGANPDVIGQSILANRTSYTIIGIMPPGFRFPVGWLLSEVDFWTPLSFTPAERGDRGTIGLEVVARLRSGVTIRQAQANLDVIARQLAAAYPTTNKDWGAHLMLLDDRGVSDWRPLFALLSLAAGVVLLVGCANVANLLLARGLGRQREFTLRAALGARRTRIVRQVVTEGVVLASLGGALGIVLAFWGIRMLAWLAPVSDLPELRHVGLNLRVLGFGVGVSVATGFLFSLAPAVTRSHVRLRDALQDHARSGAGWHAHRAQALMAAAELALTLPLLVCAGALYRTFHAYMTEAPGFVADGVVTMRLSLPTETYSQDSQWTACFDRALEGIKTIPGVEAAAVGNGAPMEDGGDVMKYRIAGRTSAATDKSWSELLSVSLDYFRATGIELHRGRLFTDRDRAGAPPVALVSEALVRREFPGQDPIGQRIEVLGDVNRSVGTAASGPPIEIVGVIADTREYSFFNAPTPMIYVPFAQSPRRAVSLMIKTAADPSSVLPAIHDRLLKVDPDQPIYNVQTLTAMVRDHHALYRLEMMLLASFAGIALVLSLVGTYGVMAYFVNGRVREFGVRMALGAERRQILRFVLWRGAWLSALGLAVGLAAAWPAMVLLSNAMQPFPLVGHGAVMVSATAASTAAIALLACVIPARRATQVEPMTILRSE
jgi:putative ABC transport system permease protein